MTTQKELRVAFWRDHQGMKGISRRKITHYSGNGKMFNTDTRCAWTDYKDHLQTCGVISQELAYRATL